ncbi:hypothetical protein HAX54_029296 [Datura stramonium]|uniref:Uncharacterized protein n=1 Tax=Datura stramonium TaxID=4076 RepID=A0ABS8SA72_DATST|nr:hypothetical protein [Datura stramonium]
MANGRESEKRKNKEGKKREEEQLPGRHATPKEGEDPWCDAGGEITCRKEWSKREEGWCDINGGWFGRAFSGWFSRERFWWLGEGGAVVVAPLVFRDGEE